MDETRCQLSNELGEELTTKEARKYHSVTCTVNEENILVILFCNSEGTPLSIVLTIKLVSTAYFLERRTDCLLYTSRCV